MEGWRVAFGLAGTRWFATDRAATEVYADGNKKNLLKAKGGVRIVDLPQADHYLFLSNGADVLREMRVFLATFPS